MKLCRKCKSNSSSKWYSGPKCEKCYKKEWYENNKNSKKQKERKQQYYIENKERLIKQSVNYNKINKEKVKKQKRKWYHANKDKLPNRYNYFKEYYRNRYTNDPEFKIKVNLRNRLNIAIKKQLKSGSAISNLGCSIDELKAHLESRFQPGMSWDNYGKEGWHIDHIEPLSKFDLTNKEQLKKACHYSNLQPLWANDNLSKGNK